MANDDTYTTDEDTELSVDATNGVLVNDTNLSDENDASSSLALAVTNNPSLGSLVLNDDGSFTYTPNSDENGEDTFSYTITKTSGNTTTILTDSATVTLTITATNDAPNVVNDSASAELGETITITPLSNDSDVDGDTLTLQSASASAGTAVINGNNISYTAPTTGNSDTISYAVSDGTTTTSGSISVTLSEATFSGNFDPDGDGDSDVSASQSGNTYAISFGDDVEAVWYEDDNGDYVEISPDDNGEYALNVTGSGARPKSNKSTGGIKAQLSNFDVTPSGNQIDIFYTINSTEYSFSVNNLNQNTATVNFGAPVPLNTDFSGTSSFDFFVRDETFKGPIRAGEDSGMRYQLMNGGFGYYHGTRAYSALSWSESAGVLQISFSGAEEVTETMSVYDLDDDNSDGVAYGVITKSEADNFYSTYLTDQIDVYVAESQHTISMLKDHRIYVDAQISRIVAYRVDSGTYPSLTNLHSQQISSVPITENVQLLDISTLRINTLKSTDITGGIFMQVPLESSSVFDGFEPDLCNFTETSTDMGTGSCVLTSLTFSWSLSGGILSMSFSNGTSGIYRWLNNLSFENTFIAEASLFTSTYSSINYWLPVTSPSDTDIVTALANNFYESGEIGSDPDNVDGTGKINNDKAFGYYFDYSGTGTSGNAKNVFAFKSANNADVIIDSDRKWQVGSSVVSLNGISSISSGGTASYIYDLCDETLASATCFLWEVREWFVAGIDNAKIWVLETERQNTTGPSWSGSIAYTESLKRRITYYELNNTIPGAPDSINFNQEPVQSSDPNLTTTANTTLSNIDYTPYLFDPESDPLTITATGATNGVITDNGDNTFNYTPDNGFTGTDDFWLIVDDGINYVEFLTGITVSAASAPIAVDDNATTVATLETYIFPLVNDSDPNSDPLTITAASANNGTVSRDVTNTYLIYTAPQGFTGTDTINYTIDDGNTNTDTATVTVTVTSPILESNYDVDGSGMDDVSAVETSTDVYQLTFGSEVDAVFTTDGGYIQPISRNASGVFSVTLDGTDPTPPVFYLIIDGVQYTFTPDELNTATPVIIFNTPTTLALTWGVSSNLLALKYPAINGVLDTSKQNGTVYYMDGASTGFVDSQGAYFDSTEVTWSQSADTLTINFNVIRENIVEYSVYDLVSLGVISSSEASNYELANGTVLVNVNVANITDQFQMTQNNSYYYSANLSATKRYRIDSSTYPTITSANSGVNAVEVSQDVELLDLAQAIFTPWTSSLVTAGELVLPMASSSSGAFEYFTAHYCTFVLTGTDSGTGTCDNVLGSGLKGTLNVTWSITNSGLDLNVVLPDGTSNLLNWIHENTTENTVLLRHFSSSPVETHATMDFWFQPRTFTTAELSTFLSGNYLDSSFAQSNPLALDTSGDVLATETDGLYFDASGASKELIYVDDDSPGALIDRDWHWSVVSATQIDIEARSNFNSDVDSYNYLYDQCTNQDDWRCYIWRIKRWKPLAIEGNRLYVMEEYFIDSTYMGQLPNNFAANTSLDVEKATKIHFYELESNVPGAPDSTNFNQEPQVTSTLSLTTPENTTLSAVDILSVVQDPEGDTLSVISAVAVLGSTFDNGDNTFDYTAPSSYIGTDTLYFLVSDGTNDVYFTEQVSITTSNTPPVASDDNISMTSDSSVIIDVLGNDYDFDGDLMTITGTPTATSGTVSIVPGGQYLKYTAPSTSGTETLAYVADDGNGGTDSGQVNVTVGALTGSLPVATDDSITVPASTKVIITPVDNDSDADGNDTLSIDDIALEGFGNAFVDSDNLSIHYTASSATGTETITYELIDDTGNSDTAQITITVSANNNAPVPTADAYTLLADGNSSDIEASAGVLNNDTDTDQNVLVANLISGPSYSSAFSLNSDGSFNYTHDGSANYSDSFTYETSDNANDVGPTTVTLTLLKDNFTPDICSTLPAYAYAGEFFNIPVDVTDAESDSLTLTLSGEPAWMSIVHNSGYSYSLQGTPGSVDVGTTSNITLTVDDGLETLTKSFDMTVYERATGTDTVDVNIATGTEHIQDIAVDRRGNLVLVGNNASTGQGLVIRLAPDGSLDAAFDGDGSVGFDNTATPADSDVARAVAIRPDNGMVVVGEYFDGSEWNSFIRAYNEDGSLDTTFSGDGIELVDVSANNQDDFAFDVELLSNGNIFVATRSYNSGTGLYELVTHMYQSNGTLDSDYDSDGIHVYAHSSDIFVSDTRLSDEGYIYVVGTASNSNHDMFVARYTPAGLDAKFDGSGIYFVPFVTTDYPTTGYALEIDTDGDLLVVGSIDSGQADFVAVNLNVDFNTGTGNYDVTPNTSFAGDSELVMDPPANAPAAAQAIISDKRGNYYVIGRATSSTETFVAKISADGVLDTTYGNSGYRTVGVTGHSGIEANAVLGPDGQLIVVDSEDNVEDNINVNYEFILTSPTFGNCNIAADEGDFSYKSDDFVADLDEVTTGEYYVAGYGIPSGETYKTFIVAKVSDDGAFDVNFGEHGIVRITGDNTDHFLAAKASVASDNGYVIAGTRTSTNNWFMAKVTPEGELDTNFDTDGMRDVISSGAVDIREVLIDPVSQEVLVAYNSSNTMFVAGFTSNGADNPTVFGEGSTNGSVQNSVNNGTNYTNYTDTNFDIIDLERSTSTTNLYAIGEFYTGSYDAPALIKMDSDGVVDASFGSNGLTYFDMGSDATLIDSVEDGTGINMLVRMTSDETLRVVRFLPSGGTLDNTFGSGGIVELPYLADALATSKSSIAVNSGGKIWIQANHSASGKQMIRLNADGSLDVDSVNGGYSKIPGGISSWENVKGLYVTSSDDALLYGEKTFNNNGNFNEDWAFALLKNTGVVSPDLAPWYIDFGEGEFSSDIALDGYSRLLMAGHTFNNTDIDEDFAIARFNNDGSADSGWGNAPPLQSYSTAALNDRANSISVSAEGSILVSGTQFDNSTPSAIDAYRFKTDNAKPDVLASAEYVAGTLGFNSSETAVEGQFLASDGSLYIVGESSGMGFIARIQPDGNLDTGFGPASSKLQMSDVNGSWIGGRMTAVTPTSQGTLIIAGEATDDGSDFDAVVFEITLDGIVVSTFNNNIGYIAYNLNSNEAFYDVTTGPDGNIYAVGYSGTDGLIVSFTYSKAGSTGNGILNTGFSGDGILAIDLLSDNDMISAIQKDAFGGLLVLGVAGVDHNLLRYDISGSEVNNYGRTRLSPTDKMQDIAIDSLGNIYVTGYTQHLGKWHMMSVRYPNGIGPF